MHRQNSRRSYALEPHRSVGQSVSECRDWDHLVGAKEEEIVILIIQIAPIIHTVTISGA